MESKLRGEISNAAASVETTLRGEISAAIASVESRLSPIGDLQLNQDQLIKRVNGLDTVVDRLDTLTVNLDSQIGEMQSVKTEHTASTRCDQRPLTYLTQL